MKEEKKSRSAKQVIVMRKDLNMRKGKMIAQGAHASGKVLLDSAVDDAMKSWLENGVTKICVYVNSEQELRDIFKQARQAKLPSALITDSGHTEFRGIPTVTCCAIGPAWSEDVDKITGELPLL